MTAATTRQPHPRARAVAGVLALLGVGVLAVASGGASASPFPPQARLSTGQSAASPDGAALYRTYCASCHGTTGRGDGPVAATLRVPPPDLTTLTRRHGGTYPADYVVERIDGRVHVSAHGPSEMPVWGDALSSSSMAGRGEGVLRARVEALVQYLQRLQVRGA